ncbi:MAG TPA: glycosyltransferase N-terminal domain-containing protein [Holophagaceae bacterium]|nr:glycosyltransferase N-terminal domain-containing protein [Holophagaceae bacterium]
MDFMDATYLGLSAVAGGAARGLLSGLPPGWRMRLEAEPAEDLPIGRWIWVHAVSVGELLVAEGLIGRLRDRGHRLHLTTGTAAGLELMARRLPILDGGTGLLSGGAFPFDDLEGLRAWRQAKPGLFLALETELWPGLMRALAEDGVPRALVNGRLTSKSLRNPFAPAAARRFDVIAARDAESAEAFQDLGAPLVRVAGNLKADLPLPPPLHEGWNHLLAAWAEEPMLVAGNTVEGEEGLLLDLWRRLRERHPGLRLILAPRQPRRFGEVASLLEGQAFRRASEPWPGTPGPWRDTAILLLDTLGELSRVYGEGTLALVGGGWAWDGGHNPLEPLRFGVPTLIGPGYRNFEDLVAPLLGNSELRVVEAEQLASETGNLLTVVPNRGPGTADPALSKLLGATDRAMALLDPLLPAPIRMS